MNMIKKKIKIKIKKEIIEIIMTQQFIFKSKQIDNYGGWIPKKFTCDGLDWSPSFRWCHKKNKNICLDR
jgi:hypothetical protein